MQDIHVEPVELDINGTLVTLKRVDGAATKGVLKLLLHTQAAGLSYLTVPGVAGGSGHDLPQEALETVLAREKEAQVAKASAEAALSAANVRIGELQAQNTKLLDKLFALSERALGK
jgi:hypothetical protein